MNGTLQTIAMTDCTHAVKNMPQQLVLGSYISTGGNISF